MENIPPDDMAITIDAHLMPCYCKDHGVEQMRSRSKPGTDYFIRYTDNEKFMLKLSLIS